MIKWIFRKLKICTVIPIYFSTNIFFAGSYSYQKYNALDFENQCKFNQQYNHFLHLVGPSDIFLAIFLKILIKNKHHTYMIIVLFSGFQTSLKTFGSDIAMLGSHEYLALLYCFCSIVHTRFTTCNLFFGTLYLTKRSLFHITTSSKM